MPTVILGPIRWGGAINPMLPGGRHAWAFEVLTPVPSPGSPPGTTVEQKLQGLNVTVMPARDGAAVQALGVTELSTVMSPNGSIAVNCLVVNKHATSRCGGYKLWATVTVNEPALEI
jgi:hypothetical protein